MRLTATDQALTIFVFDLNVYKSDGTACQPSTLQLVVTLYCYEVRLGKKHCLPLLFIFYVPISSPPRTTKGYVYSIMCTVNCAYQVGNESILCKLDELGIKEQAKNDLSYVQCRSQTLRSNTHKKVSH